MKLAPTVQDRTLRALDGLATLAERRVTLLPTVRRHLRDFERSPSMALQARARQIRARLSSSS